MSAGQGMLLAPLIAVIAGLASGLSGQSGPGRTVRDQVYSDAQAVRGKAVYNDQCSNCHDGGAMGPALTGADFLASWESKSVRALYDRVLNTMPSDAPGTLQQKEALDVMAYLIKANGFSAGADELSAPDALNEIKIVRAK